MSFDPEKPPANPFQAPSAGATKQPFIGPKPQVIMWQKVYVGIMTVIYILVAVLGILAIVFANDLAAGDPTTKPLEMRVMGAVYGGLGVMLTVLFALGFVFNKGNAGWIF